MNNIQDIISFDRCPATFYILCNLYLVPSWSEFNIELNGRDYYNYNVKVAIKVEGF